MIPFGPTRIFCIGISQQGAGGTALTPTMMTPSQPFAPGRVEIRWEPRTVPLPRQWCVTSAAAATTSTAEMQDVDFTTGGRFAVRATDVRFRVDSVVGYGRARQCVAQ